jgi:hypothetical protein
LYRFILFSDEAQFTRDGVYNTHNSHVWAEINPHATVETNFQHRFSVNVCCGVLHDQLIAPFIFPGRLPGEVYLHFLQDELPQLLEDVLPATRRRMYFYHGGAPPHFSRVVAEHLNQHFPVRWIGRGGPQPRPPRSPDLTPLHFCILGRMKNIVYQTKVQTREALLVRVIHAAALIKDCHEQLRRATRAVHKRATKCIEVEGEIFENLS